MAGLGWQRRASRGPWALLTAALLYAALGDVVRSEQQIPLSVVKLWASAFGGEIKSIAAKYSGSQLLQKKYKEYEKDVAIEEIDGLQLVKKLAKNMEEMFHKKSEAVRRLVEAAEEAHLKHEFDADLQHWGACSMSSLTRLPWHSILSPLNRERGLSAPSTLLEWGVSELSAPHMRLLPHSRFFKVGSGRRAPQEKHFSSLVLTSYLITQ